MQRKWALRWAVFLTAAVVAFFGLELPALADPASGDTLSEFIRTGIQHFPELGGAALIAGLAWFGWHILRKVR